MLEPLVEMTAGEKIRLFIYLFFTRVSRTLVVLHTHFALLYLRVGLCRGLACRRSAAIFTSENKPIQTFNITVKHNSLTQSTFLRQMEGRREHFHDPKWNWAPEFQVWKSKLDEVIAVRSHLCRAEWEIRCTHFSLIAGSILVIANI